MIKPKKGFKERQFASFFVLYGKIAGALPIFDRYTSTVFYSGSNYKVEAMTCSAEQQHSSCLNQNTYHKKGLGMAMQLQFIYLI